MVDLAFTDIDGFYYVVDVKTHRLDSKFNMPNLTSVERLARFYQEDSKYVVILHVGYTNRLAALARDVIQQDPLSGHLFVFQNRPGDRTTDACW